MFDSQFPRERQWNLGNFDVGKDIYFCDIHIGDGDVFFDAKIDFHKCIIVEKLLTCTRNDLVND